MSAIVVHPVQTRRQRRDFLNLTYRINAGRSLWVPPLRSEQKREIDPRRNPFYEHAEAQLFVAYKDKRPAGRIVAIENRLHNQHWKDRVGFFGHYEAVDDCQVSRALIAAAANWLRDRGLQRMRGPTNPSMNANMGFLIDGFEYAPTIPMPYTHPYYTRQAEDAGFAKAMEVSVYGWNYDNYSQDHVDRRLNRIARLSEHVERRNNIVIRGPRRDRVDQELMVIREICNESLKDNWGFVPLTDAELQAMRRELQRVIDPDMFFIAEVDGRPEAVFLACPDYNVLLRRMNGRILPFGWVTYLLRRRRIREYVVYVYASTPRGEAAGVAAPLYRRYFENCFRKGIKNCETGYVLETNSVLRNSLDKLGAELRKRYLLYEKPLTNDRRNDVTD
jgi:hypothetical protein